MTMPEPPIFSVVIPLYNRSHLIADAIHSVLSQEFQDFELIIIDDGSTDNPDLVISKFSDGRIRYIRQENKGASAARNLGVSSARGRFVAFLDSDDVWLPYHLSQALPFLEKSPDACVYGQVTVDRGNGVRFVKPPRGMHKNEPISEYLLCDRGFFQTSSVIIPTHIAKMSMYDEKVIYGDDVDLAIKIAYVGGKFHFIADGRPSTVWNDHSIDGRLSGHISPLQIESWLERIGGLITLKAKKGCRGWAMARGYSEEGRLGKALGLYMSALLSGCYTPKMAIVVFLQIILSREAYRKLSDTLARVGIGP